MKYPFLSGFALGGALVAMVSMYLIAPSETPDPVSDKYSSIPPDKYSSIHPESCSFGIARSGEVIQAVDWSVLQPIGFFEKYNGGKIGLVTPSGYVRDVTKCFRDGKLKKYLPEIRAAG
ncbi:TPA: hypothetical protein I8273_004758 [Aeromonas hydrophila]|nr:hypothetical protein [Aeromonas hydrophila]HAT2639213.1 hypothetical protein [Aeromonas hydrophila]HAT3424414.1 hypothetical protein [Aeromonas hydrophila]HAT3534397.1 hypothetical protein [Aeromonas hydrophila]